MKMRTVAAVVCGLALTFGCALGQERAAEKKSVKAVKFGKLWDGKGKVWTNAIVIVDGERVREVTTVAQRVPDRAEVVDLTNYYGLPGLIDVHTHMSRRTVLSIITFGRCEEYAGLEIREW